MQVFGKWEKFDEAIKWYRVNISLRANDAEAYYALGTYIYNQLLLKGGGADKQMWDPRPGAINANPVPPTFAPSDIQGQQRVDFADEGLKHLAKAVELRTKHATTQREIAELDRQYKEISTDQGRLRANLKELPPTAAAYKRYLEKFDLQETEIEKLQASLKTMRTTEEQQRKDYEAYLIALEVE